MSSSRSWKSSQRLFTAACCSAVALLCVAACGPAGKPKGYVSQVEMGDQWPLTVDEGVLHCKVDGPRKSVYFFVGPDGKGQMYAVNGTAKSRAPSAAIDPIWKEAPPHGRVSPVTRLSEADRKDIFRTTVQCEDWAAKQSTREAGQKAASDVCKNKLRKLHKLTVKEFETIGNEGVNLSWFPLTRGRVNISPLIERGLALCKP